MTNYTNFRTVSVSRPGHLSTLTSSGESVMRITLQFICSGELVVKITLIFICSRELAVKITLQSYGIKELAVIGAR